MFYSESLTEYKRLQTKEVRIGDLLLGNGHPIRMQTMTTTDTMDTAGTVEQTIRCIEAGAELVRITAPSKTEAENLLLIKNELHRRGYRTPLVADIHFTPNAAEIAARIIEKVRINPGNYVDKKKFETIEYSDADYAEEIDRIRERFTPLLSICKMYGTAMRIGTNHGSLSDRIMSRYGDTPMGMVESALEFLRIARSESYHNIVLSMKSSNPQVMVQAYRLLVKMMQSEFGEIYPLHLGVTEAGDGEDGRVKSAVGIGTLLEDGIGDTIRVSLTEDPELEIPVCRDILKRYQSPSPTTTPKVLDGAEAPIDLSRSPSVSSGKTERALPYSPFEYKRRKTFLVNDIGGNHVPCVIADLSKLKNITATDLQSAGYTYDAIIDKWNISDTAADYIFIGNRLLDFALPGTLKVVVYADAWTKAADKAKYFPIYDATEFGEATDKSALLNFVMVDCFSEAAPHVESLKAMGRDKTVVLCLSSTNKNAMQSVRSMFAELMHAKIENPVVLIVDSNWKTADEHLIHYATEAGALLLDGMGDGVCFGMTPESYRLAAANYSLATSEQPSITNEQPVNGQLSTVNDPLSTVNNQPSTVNASGRNYTQNRTPEAFINNTAFIILQATRTRISKTEYISCPSCGRTLFDLQETTAKIRAVTNHLKGVKIAIMGCIVNGPGEMADADFGYVGSGVGKITLYKSKEVVKRNVPSEVAVDELINLMKESGAWVEK
ncbi:MAG TPA: (E)-4-hydroxy-3-methylbut-2-enyl-diphosphate synthase [Flavisolibacter sp.]|nr:(E)-4-hydroxy-3-methylbut-2-enyl-diphosphate synthase [Flavisolibacter sp.]